MSDLKTVRATLVATAHPERVLRYADDLMDMVRKQGGDFELPLKDAWLKPILEFYTQDLEGWMKFIKNVRDRLEPHSGEFRAVHEFYKVVNVRFIQRRTRSLIDIATDTAIRKGLLASDFLSKQRYAKRCVQAWKARKDNLMNMERKASKTGRISLDVREALLQDFWDLVSDEVNNGEVPKP